MSEIAFIFPGQGAQTIGMGREIAEAFASARNVFDEVDDALGQKLSELMFNGDQDDLTLTSNAQPALMATSLAVMAALKEGFGIDVSKAAFVAGHSLGEYSALASAGSLSVAEAARLLRVRGNAMQAAVPAGEGAMAALLGASIEQAEAACSEAETFGVCEIANDNAPGQVVLSGSKAGIDAAVAWSKDVGIKKAVLLPVSAPFHCRLMQPAAERMEAALAYAAFASPNVPLVSNIRARPETEPDALKALLVEQVTGRVRWRESVEWMSENGITTMVECGAGKVLTVMNRRTVRSLEGISLNTPSDLEAFAKTLENKDGDDA